MLTMKENLDWLNAQIEVLDRMIQGFELSAPERTAVQAGRTALRTLTIHADADMRQEAQSR